MTTDEDAVVGVGDTDALEVEILNRCILVGIDFEESRCNTLNRYGLNLAVKTILAGKIAQFTGLCKSDRLGIERVLFIINHHCGLGFLLCGSVGSLFCHYRSEIIVDVCTIDMREGYSYRCSITLTLYLTFTVQSVALNHRGSGCLYNFGSKFIFHVDYKYYLLTSIAERNSLHIIDSVGINMGSGTVSHIDCCLFIILIIYTCNRFPICVTSTLFCSIPDRIYCH